MAQSDALKKYLDAGLSFTEMTRTRARSIVKDLVAAGELQQKQAAKMVEELVDRSRRNTEDLVSIVRKEVQSQLSNLGLATQADVEAISEQIVALGGKPITKSTGSAKKSTKAPAKKAAAKKTAKAADAAPANETASAGVASSDA
jgi:polyhydroxyalkanoate synthesis regulator phasin